MRLPSDTAGFMSRVAYGWYVWQRLVRAGATDLALTANTVNQALLAAGRRLEDLQLPEMEAIANRDADDDDLDETAQHIRLQLASRSLGASRERPYVEIFPQGIEHYISATLSMQSTRYAELVERTVAHLPETDPVRVVELPKLEAGIARWEQSAAAVGAARNTIAIARTARDNAVEDWKISMERVYGGLEERFGKKKAERFFPRTGRKRTVAAAEPAPENGGERWGPTG